MSELGLDDYFAEVLPHKKSPKIRETKDRGSVRALVSDAVNDEPALVEADVGSAIGAGTDGLMAIDNQVRRFNDVRID